MPELVAFREDRLGFRYNLKDKNILGRAPDCDLILFDRSASRKHAEITKLEDNYFIVDLDSTNGTLVNDQPIMLQTKLNTFDCIKIGQEIFVFSPFLDIVGGPAPSAIILNALNETQINVISKKAPEAARSITQEQAELLVHFNHLLCNTHLDNLPATISSFMVEHIGATSISILWPANNTILNQISFISFPDDKRLLISQIPYKRVTEMEEALLWPRIISELDFHAGDRHVGQIEQNCLMVPLYGNLNNLGLLYVENNNRALDEADLNFLATAALIISPFLTNMTSQKEIDKDRQLSLDNISNNDVVSKEQHVRIVYSTASHVAQTDTPIFISGELGTGKTSLANYIHQQSPKKKGRFVTATLSDLPPAQMDRILFGQEGTEDSQIGLLSLANNGTIFLRHLEYLTPNAQRSILMALEEGLVYPIGSRHSIPINTRFISASSSNLVDLVENGSFREDLYTRLTRISLSIPPLRESKNDIENLANRFVGKAARNLGLTFRGIDPAALECLRAYPWPGNISELRSESIMMAHFNHNGYITMEDLPLYMRLAQEAFNHGDPNPESLIGETERYLLFRTLSCHAGDIEVAADILGLTPEDVIIKSRAYSLDPMDYQGQLQMRQPRGPGQTSLPSEN